MKFYHNEQHLVIRLWARRILNLILRSSETSTSCRTINDNLRIFGGSFHGLFVSHTINILAIMRWTSLPQVGTLPVERSSHSITALGNRILLFGGEHDPRVPVGSELYEYSFADGTWCVVDAKGEPPTPRVAHASAAVGNKLYIFGGRSGLAMGEGASNDLYVFDSDTCTWARLDGQGDIPPKRSYHTMTAVANKVYVFGGCGEEGRLSDLYEYDTTTNTWRQLALPLPQAVPGRGGSCLVAAPKPGGPEGEWVLYVIAGFCGRELDDMHVYSISDNVWCGSNCPSCSPPSSETTEGDGHSHCKLSARSVFGAAVHSCDQGDCTSKDTVVAFGGEVDPSAKGHDGAGDFCGSLMAFGSRGIRDWRAIEAGGDAPGPRGWFASTTTPDGRLVIHGGLDANNERLRDMFVLDMHADST